MVINHGFSDWRSGFFPGSVWYLYELTDDNTLLSVAQKYTEALDEAKGVENYNYIVINDKVDDCVEAIHSIVNSEKRKAVNNMSLINNIKEELKAYEKGE